MKDLNIGCLVMAAGNARRFGENKLTASVDGKSLAARALEAVPAELFSRVVVVTQYDAVEKLANAFSFTVIRNSQPELGLSHTIHLGTEALEDLDAICYLVADQPLLRRKSVADLVALYRENPDSIAALAHNGVRDNPCIFPARFFPELMSLTGDRGGSGIIRAHEKELIVLDVDARELWDVDTPEALEILKKEL